jgi:hypothetical protein
VARDRRYEDIGGHVVVLVGHSRVADGGVAAAPVLGLRDDAAVAGREVDDDELRAVPAVVLDACGLAVGCGVVVRRGREGYRVGPERR